VAKARPGIRFNKYIEGDCPTSSPMPASWGSKVRVEVQGLGLPFRTLARRFNMKNSDTPAMKREVEEDWGRERWR
jgi:hypothetical protein